MNLLALDSYIFFVKQAVAKQIEMENNYKNGNFIQVVKGKSQFDGLISRAKTEKCAINNK